MAITQGTLGTGMPGGSGKKPAKGGTKNSTPGKAKDMKDALAKVEKTAEDKARDKAKGYKEGSKADVKDDKAQAKRMLAKGAKPKHGFA